MVVFNIKRGFMYRIFLYGLLMFEGICFATKVHSQQRKVLFIAPLFGAKGAMHPGVELDVPVSKAFSKRYIQSLVYNSYGKNFEEQSWSFRLLPTGTIKVSVVPEDKIYNVRKKRQRQQ